MRYLTSCYYANGKPQAALTLQQVRRKRGRRPMLLACVCETEAGAGGQDEGGRFCVRLTDWFYERVLERWGRGGGAEFTGFGEEISRMAQNARFSATGLLCAEERFLLFYRGRQRVYLLNSRFLRPHLKRISADTDAGGGLRVEEGILQRGVGVLLGTAGFYQDLAEEEILGCLAADGICGERQAKRRLSELGEAGERRLGKKLSGESGRAAVLVVTADGGTKGGEAEDGGRKDRGTRDGKAEDG